MVTEIAQIDVKPGMESEFEAGVGKARAVFGRARGFKSLALHRSIDPHSWCARPCTFVQLSP
jgi:heme-degrading monooxygenase HmoA